MAKTIKLTDGCYIGLDAIRQKDETFSETVERLIKVFTTITDISGILGPSHYLRGPSPHQEAVVRKG